MNGKHVVGECKEKELARKEYKEAVARGHGAYLMDEEKSGEGLSFPPAEVVGV